LAEIFELHLDGQNWPRAFFILTASLVLLIVFLAIDKEQYFLSALYAALFTAVIDPGGMYGYRASHMAAFAVAGALVTALGFGMGTAAWGWVVLAAFVVTLLAGLTVTFGLHRFVAGMLLNTWFVIALVLPNAYKLDGTTSETWGQVLAWVAGSALWIVFTWGVWMARGRTDRPQPIPEIPGDISPRELTRPLILFAVIRALALAIAIAIPFGLNLPHAAWMPLAALVAMKPSLNQATLVAEQRVAGTLIGGVLAAVLLLTVDNKHVLEAAIIVAFTVGAAIRGVNYAHYTAAIAVGVLLALDLSHPSNLSAEGQRVLYTFIGVGIAVVVMLLANLLAKRTAQAQPQPGSQPRPGPQPT
jgi:hypothetical protein